MSTTNPIHQKAYGRTNNVRHSKDDALTETQFEQLLEGARRLNDDYYLDSGPEFAIYILGRLGLRRGELAHLKEDWIDWREEMIRIPSHEPCRKGKDGGPCGYCRQLAEQRAEHNDEIDVETALDWTWTPKTKAAARDVYFGFDPRLKLYIERFFDRNVVDGWPASANAVNRRVNRAAEEADGLKRSMVHPHALRATAATWHSSRGLEMLPLMQLMGWAQPQTAEVYIGRSGENTARQLNAIHSR